MSKEGDKSAARIWEEYEERWSPRRRAESQEQGREDEIYAARNLLKVHNRPYVPLVTVNLGGFYGLTEVGLKKNSLFFWAMRKNYGGFGYVSPG